jgi:hypothetical protein
LENFGGDFELSLSSAASTCCGEDAIFVQSMAMGYPMESATKTMKYYSGWEDRRRKEVV